MTRDGSFLALFPNPLPDGSLHAHLVSTLRLILPILGLTVPLMPAALGQTAHQPKVAPGPNEPDWKVVLEERYGLSMFGDLENPVESTAAATPGLFRKAGPGPVTFAPAIALGLETPEPRRMVHARTGPGAAEAPALDLHFQEHRPRREDRQQPAAAP